MRSSSPIYTNLCIMYCWQKSAELNVKIPVSQISILSNRKCIDSTATLNLKPVQHSTKWVPISFNW